MSLQPQVLRDATIQFCITATQGCFLVLTLSLSPQVQLTRMERMSKRTGDATVGGWPSRS